MYVCMYVCIQLNFINSSQKYFCRGGFFTYISLNFVTYFLYLLRTDF